MSDRRARSLRLEAGRRGSARCKNSCSGDPPRRGSDRDLETRHQAVESDLAVVFPPADNSGQSFAAVLISSRRVFVGGEMEWDGAQRPAGPDAPARRVIKFFGMRREP
jgi:hypothetical protein